jgi:glyoxylase-like metal-dependent hydrolase (beta-lactamase superfamily II)
MQFRTAAGGPSQPDHGQPDLSRHTVLAGASASLLLPGLVGACPPARAEAARRLNAGRFKVTTLSEGYLVLPTSVLAPDADKDQRAKALTAAGQSGDQDRSPLNVTLLQSDNETILIDVGSGSRFMTSAGRLEAALADFGVEADAITHVVFTHAHPDHLWGTGNDFDEIAFPNASFHIAEAEWNFWMADDVLNRLDKARHGFAVGAKRNFEAIKSRLATFMPGAEVLPDIRAIGTEGHTPGNVSFEDGDAKSRIAILGDALPHAVLCFQHPAWHMAMDHEPDRAAATRQRLLDRRAADGHQLIGYHLPEPAIGRVQRRGRGFVFASTA